MFRAVVFCTALLLASRIARADDPPPAPAPAPPVIIRASGRVIDMSGKPVRDATVSVEASTNLVKTDDLGRFSIEAPANATLIINSDRYGAALATVTGPVLDDVVLLQDAAAEQIEVKGQLPTPAIGAAQLDREELQRLPGTGGDVVRTLSAMPGVVNVQIPLGYSGVVVRGSSPQDSKVLVDDFEIPILFHPFGFRAIMPVETVQSLTFIPGGFGVEYGRSSSGIVALATRPGDEKRTTQAEVSLIDGGIVAQGKIDDKTRYMIGLRRSVIDLVLPLVIPSSVDLSLTTVPSYYDEQLRIDHEINSSWNVSLSSIGTTDVLELYTTKNEDAGAKHLYTRTRFIRLTAAAKYHEGPWTANLALSGMLQDVEAEVGLYQKLLQFTPSITPRAVVTRSSPEAIGLKDVVWSTGVEAQVSHAKLDIAIPVERREGEPYQPYDPKDTSTSFKGTIWYPDYAAWTSLSANFDPRIRITTGFRADMFQRSGEVALQPRTDIQIKVKKDLTARFGAGSFARPPEFQSELLTKNLQSERATQLTMGLEYVPLLGIRIQGSLYYNERYDLITRNDDGSLGNNGRGNSKGAEILAMITDGQAWFGWFGYSYSNSTRVDAPGATPRLFDYDQPHSLNAALSWKHGRHWTIGGRFQLYSGLPETPVVGAEFDSDRNIHIPISGPINSDRAPLHHELDLRVDYAWKWGTTQMLAFLDVQNVYLDRSVITEFYGYDYTQKSAFESLPLIPSVGLRAVF
ncbi:MAG TPA: TonB-dependent receptor [Kofleriaceae bacterium]